MQRGAFHARHEFDSPGLPYILNKAIDDGIAELAVSHLAALEAKRGLYLVALIEEAHGLILFGLVVMLVDGDRELDFLDGDNFLLLAGGAVALVLFVQILAVILDAANRRDRVGRNFHQVETTLAGNFQSFKRGKDAELRAVLINDADLAGADSFVDTNKLLC